MAVTEVLLKKGLGKVGEKVLGVAGKVVPGVGTAFTLTSLLKEFIDKHAEEVRDAAREKLGCVHVELCPQKIGAGPTTNMVEYAAEEHGMAFQFDGIALCHAQADFDVKQLSTWVWRWGGKNVVKDAGGLHLKPCLICSRKPKKPKD